MKKHLSKITSLVLSLVIIFSGIFSIIVSADTTEERPPMIVDHFENLDGTPSGPPNMSVTELIDGTCAFVAMSMILAYYDSYWNDRIVPENLDWEQGRYNSAIDELDYTFNTDNEKNAWDGRNVGKNAFIDAHKNEYLQCYLLDMCNNLPIIDELGVFAYQTQDILEYYLYEDQNFDESEIKVKFYRAHNDAEKEIMINTAQNLIENGHPVIFSGLALDFNGKEVDGDDAIVGGHSMIGYDYTLSNGKYDIKLNLCWNGSERQYIRSSDFQYINSIIWLEITEENLPHECTDAYYDEAIDDNVCSCYVYYNTHPEHQSHNYQYNEYNTSHHWERCYCGEQNALYDHNLRYYQSSGTSHLERCIECSYQATVSHNYVNYINNVSTHGAVCACGYVNEEEHYRHSFEQYDKTNHKVYCACGHYIGTENHTMVTSGRYATCTDCGVVVDTFFIPVIKGIEENYDIE